MPISLSQLATDLDNIIADLPAVVTFGASTFNAAVTQATTGADINEGGFLPSRDVGLHVRATDVTRAIKVGSKLSVSSAGIVTEYRVITVERSQDGNELILSCRSHRR